MVQLRLIVTVHYAHSFIVGLDVWLNIHQEEYVAWTDVAGFRIFIHNQSEQVFSESLSYYAPGGAHVGLGLAYVWS